MLSYFTAQIQLETNPIGLETQLNMLSRESRILNDWGIALTKRSPGFTWHNLEFNFQVQEMSFQLYEYGCEKIRNHVANFRGDTSS